MAKKVRVDDIAREAGWSDKGVLALAKELGLDVKAKNSRLDETVALAMVDYYMKRIDKNELVSFINKMQNSEGKKPSRKVNSAKKIENPKRGSETKQDIQKPSIQKASEEGSEERISGGREAKQVSARKVPETSVAIVLDDTSKSKDKLVSDNAQKDSPSVNQQQYVMRRTSIRIERRSAIDSQDVTSSNKRAQYSVPSIQEMFDQIKDEGKKERPKKVKLKSPPVSHRHNELKMDIEREISDRSDEDDNEILLFDFSDQSVQEEDREVKQAMVDRIKIQRRSPWINDGGISRKRRKTNIAFKKTEEKVKKDSISIPQEVRVHEFADLAGLKINEVLKVLWNLGTMATKNDFLDSDAIEILCDEFKINFTLLENEEDLSNIFGDVDEGELVVRPPVVTIMGHVDHGKTSLLDRIRNTRIVHAEAGGITQHIGAYSVIKNNRMISFIDTPGHEAFSEMRVRGAQVTDIAVIVVAADDGVRQQTIEAFNHAKAANVQIIVAMNKIDKQDINIDKLKSECAELGFTPSDWGGDTEFIGVSARTGEGIEDLLDTILLQADILELKANPSSRARAVVLEGSIDKGRGAVATIIMQNGTLRLGDSVVADTTYGRVRALIDDMGKSIKELGPSGVAVVVGLSGVPAAGSILAGVQNDALAREYAAKRASYLRQKQLSKSTKVSLDELKEMVVKGNLKNLPVIIKADTQGSLEAIKSSVLKLSNDEIEINIVGFGVGGITEGDVALASASRNCVIVGFNIRPTGSVKLKAKEYGVEIKTYNVIYALIDDLRSVVTGMMSPVLQEEYTGQAEVRETFNIPRIGTVAGCVVVDGVIQKGIKIRLIRGGVVVYDGTISSLKRFKDDVREVKNGYECGIMLDNYNNIEIGDVFETYRQVPRGADTRI